MDTAGPAAGLAGLFHACQRTLDGALSDDRLGVWRGIHLRRRLKGYKAIFEYWGRRVGLNQIGEHDENNYHRALLHPHVASVVRGHLRTIYRLFTEDGSAEVRSASCLSVQFHAFPRDVLCDHTIRTAEEHLKRIHTFGAVIRQLRKWLPEESNAAQPRAYLPAIAREILTRFAREGRGMTDDLLP